jgi:hypothetical protein
MVDPEQPNLLLIGDDEDEVYSISGKLIMGKNGPEFIRDDGVNIPLGGTVGTFLKH